MYFFYVNSGVRLKLDEEGSLEKLDDVFLLLGSVTSTDSFLLYHQEDREEHMSKYQLHLCVFFLLIILFS